MVEGSQAAPAPAEAAPAPLWRSLLYFLYLGALGFGGPIALAGYMRRDLVERRGRITPEDYQVGLALAQLAPGPLAAQLAIYLGYVRGGFWGATMVGAFFIRPRDVKRPNSRIRQRRKPSNAFSVLSRGREEPTAPRWVLLSSTRVRS